MIRRISTTLLVMAVLIAGGRTIAHADPTSYQTWVSGTGDDSNFCTRTEPCKTFIAALGLTEPGGEIRVLDPGNFGSVTIGQSVSIVGEGNGSIVVGSGTAITINGNTSTVVSLRGIQLEGTGNGAAGISVVRAGKVYISESVIRGFRASGQGQGLVVQNTAGAVRIYLNRVEINNNRIGIEVTPAVSASAAVFIDNCVVEANTANPLVLSNARAAAATNGSRLAATATVLTGGARLISLGNNFIVDAVPTQTVPQK